MEVERIERVETANIHPILMQDPLVVSNQSYGAPNVISENIKLHILPDYEQSIEPIR